VTLRARIWAIEDALRHRGSSLTAEDREVLNASLLHKLVPEHCPPPDEQALSRAKARLEWLGNPPASDEEKKEVACLLMP
jgi:hypothetical protein